MNHVALVLCCLTGCGVPQLSFGEVDAEWRPDLEAVAAELNEAARQEVVVFEAGGSHALVASAPLIAARSKEYGKRIAGYVFGTQIVMLPYGEASRVAGPELTRSIVAHELGHLLGLGHSDRGGIMWPSLTSECVGREGTCLAEALRVPQDAP
jgi:hypothetical protein